jgi:uncharacterized protein with von Willebrand factor type A (vWA) domain
MLLENLLLFGRLLRSAGIPVHPGRLLDVVEAFGHVDLGKRDDVYHTCRALLVHRQDQLALFDRVFAAFWREHHERPARDTTPRQPSSSPVVVIEDALAPGEPDARDDGESEGHEQATSTGTVRIWSNSGGLADKDFAAFSDDEIAEARHVIGRLRWNPGDRVTRRWVRGRGRQIDLRRAIAASLRTGGDVVSLPRRSRRLRPRPLVLLCDVSGSMERYTRMLLHFAHSIIGRNYRVEVFLFATRLTRITAQLQRSRPDAAVSAVARSVGDWSGGTRIGGAIKELHQQWGGRVLARSPVVLLISDGWDRGDPEELRAQIARLRRRSRRLVWLNPLIGTTDYAPLTRGLQAALPYVDDFLPSRTLTNLADLALHLNALA